MNKLIGSQYLIAQFLWTHLFLSSWTNDVTNFQKVMKLIASLNCHLRFSIFVLETFKFEWQCSQYLELNPTFDNVNSGDLNAKIEFFRNMLSWHSSLP